jgi:hypothetical protein
VREPLSIAGLEEWRDRCAAVAAAGFLLCLLGGLRHGDQFFRSYLCAYLFWFGLGAGCLGLLLLHYIVGGGWGELVRPMLEAGAGTVPRLAVLFVPLLFGLGALYPWTRAEALAADAVLRHKQAYLNVPFFIARAAGCFALWSWLFYRLRRRPAADDAAGATAAVKLAAVGLLAMFLTLTLGAIDWTMSLEPRWYSTVYPLLLICGHAASALAFAIAALGLIGDGRRLSRELPSKPFVDVGNLLLATVMLWAYAGFSQYLIIWSGGIPLEISWYIKRQNGVWFAGGLAMIAAMFGLPFLLLLARRNKARLERLTGVALLVVAGRYLEAFWLVKPAAPAAPAVSWLDAAAALAIGGAWLSAFFGRLALRPLVAQPPAEPS